MSHSNNFIEGWEGPSAGLDEVLRIYKDKGQTNFNEKLEEYFEITTGTTGTPNNP
jgi:hypothetical protein